MLDSIDFLLSHKTFIAIFLSSLFLVLILTPVAGWLAQMLGAIDRPDHRKIHARPTPRMGGLAVYLAVWLPILAFYFWQNALNERLGGQWFEIFVVAVAGGAVMLSGILDDIRGLNAFGKLVVQVPIAYLFARYVGYFHSITVPYFGSLSLGIWGAPLTMLWIVGITNALNLVDGIDGLATGVAIVIALTNSIIALAAGNDFLAIVMLGMAGACLGFLYYNFAPAKIFLGDTGSLFIGMTMATASVLTSAKSDVAASFFVALIVLGYPVMDTLLAMTRRKLYGRPMFSADHGHIHHRLLAKGFDHPRASLFIYGICACFSILALAMVLQNSIATFFSLVLVAGAILAALNFLGFFKLLNPEEVKKTKTNYIISYHLSEMLNAKLSIAENIDKLGEIFEHAGVEFGFLSVEITFDPVLVKTQKNGKRVWVDEKKLASYALRKAVTRANSFIAPGGLLEVEVRYAPEDFDNELLQEYLTQMSRLTNKAAERIQELFPPLKKPARGIDS